MAGVAALVPGQTGSMQRLSPLDVSFLHLERDVQQLNVGSALIFEGPAPTYDEVCTAIEVLLPAFPRYRQHVRRVPLDLALPVWADDPRFQLRDHVGHRRLRSPGTDDALRKLAVRLISQPLDLDRPLWHSWLVTGLRGGRFALVNTNHHAMIDGISGSDIISVLLTTSPLTPQREAPRSPVGPEPGAERGAARRGRLGRARIEPGPGGAGPGSGRACSAISESVAEVVGMARFGEQMAHLELGLNGPLGPAGTGVGCVPTSTTSRP